MKYVILEKNLTLKKPKKDWREALREKKERKEEGVEAPGAERLRERARERREDYS